MPVHCSLNPDRTVYFVLERFRDGLAWVERPVDRTDKKSTIEDLRTGQFRDVVQVIELNVAEFSSRDVTDDMLAEAKNEAAIHWCADADLAADRRDWQRDHIADHRKNWVRA